VRQGVICNTVRDHDCPCQFLHTQADTEPRDTTLTFEDMRPEYSIEQDKVFVDANNEKTVRNNEEPLGHMMFRLELGNVRRERVTRAA
jgi:hypothetical protein